MPDPRSVETLRQLLDALVAFPTVSRVSNLALIDPVEEWLGLRGISASRVFDESGNKASLYAGTGPDAEGGVLLSGHVDVVPVDGQDWTTDPFQVSERCGRLYGRGTCDMKGFDALALWAMAEAARRGVQRPLQIALTRDEEIGCLAPPGLIADMRANGFAMAEAAIIGEPTGMACVTGHKGGFAYAIAARGNEVHSSMMHEGVSAIMESARIIQWANECNEENAAARPSDLAARFVPPWTTIHTGLIEGGTAHNITAGECRFGVDFQLVPGEAMDHWRERLLDELRRVGADMAARHPSAGFSWEGRFVVPALRPETNGAAEAMVRAITGDNGTHVVSYGLEAGQFQDAGYSAVVCGPGDFAKAHQAGEYIEVAQFEAGHRFMRALVDRLAA